MPLCTCSECGRLGVELESKAIRRHTVRDRNRQHVDASQRAVEMQAEEVANYLSSLSLNDKMTIPPSGRGSRLWDKNSRTPGTGALAAGISSFSSSGAEMHSPDDESSEPDVSRVTSSHLESPRKFRVANLLRALADIEENVKILSDATSARLKALGSITGDVLPSFPLGDLSIQAKVLS